jgi:hypothetical protein
VSFLGENKRRRVLQVAVVYAATAWLHAAHALSLALLLILPGPAFAQDLNIPVPVSELERMLTTEPFRIVMAEISRPKAKGDITLKAEVAFGDRAPFRVKLRKAEPGADTFNNVPRYDIAAYELQKLLMDPPDYVVPPTALRMVPLAEFKVYSADVRPTFRGADEVLGVVQYWLQEIRVVADVYDAARFDADPVYARHIGQLNIFTYLIEHRDSNAGNFLISKAPTGARVFSVDNGVAFASEESDRGELWRKMRIKRLPADTVTRLRSIDEVLLQSRLGVLAQWELRDGRYVPVELTANLSDHRGVRIRSHIVQMGLTRGEISRIARQAARLVKSIDAGDITTF